MANLLLQHALYELLTLPEEQQKEHAEAILERLEEDAVYLNEGKLRSARSGGIRYGTGAEV